jgi:hypothetical protein
VLAVEVALAVAALAAGVTGTWSPCGFSMVETIGLGEWRRAAVAASCASFAVGCLAGGVATFAALAAVGAVLHGTGGGAATGVAAALALAAALAEAKGVRIVPQIRRQVPESWRRRLPLPAASALYGVLLGLGFTTFVLTYGVWALAAIDVALGDLRTGAVVGAAFGVGRAAPVLLVAPLLRRPLGGRLLEAMAERPSLLRGLRLADAAALGACAVALGAGAAAAATIVARGATDPALTPGALAWDRAGGAVLVRDAPAPPAVHHLGGIEIPLPGRDPALGDGLVAVRSAALVRVLREADLSPVLELPLPGVDALDVSERWLVYRRRGVAGGDRIDARLLSGQGREVSVASVGPPAQLGRPSLDGDRVVFHVARRSGSAIVEVDLSTRARRTLRRSALEALTNPSLLGGSLLYVRATNTAQLLELGPSAPAGRDRVLLRSASTSLRDSGYEPGHSRFTRTPPAGRPAALAFWTTALGPRAAYLALVPRRGGLTGARIVRVPR